MAELLSHVLLAVALFTAVGWAIDWLDREWVAVGAVGAVLPDINRLDLFVDDYMLAQLLGVQFSWDGIHTLGGVILLSAIGAILFPSRRERVRAFSLLLAGSLSHFLVDGIKAWADGANGAYLYPISWWRNPTPSWYVSSERWVLVVAVLLAVVILCLDRYLIFIGRKSRKLQ